MKNRPRTALLIAFLLSLTLLPAQQHKQKGKASFYSKRATGARTSSGERIHHDSLTCAHRTLPFGTKVKVTNPANGKSVIVKVTDRGPFGRGRIIDLSWAAAKAIGMLSTGVAMVEVERTDNIIVPFKPKDDKKESVELDFEEISDGNAMHPMWWNDNANGSKDTRREKHGGKETAHKEKEDATHKNGKEKRRPGNTAGYEKEESFLENPTGRPRPR